tara:strand:+ start:284312 stop:285337 length:1026 start_codon:yes stop_codon:yes gene_type:complete
MPSADDIQAIADYRGSFVQGTTTTLKLSLTDFKGFAMDPESISLSILDEDSNEVEAGVPEKIQHGFFIYDWQIDEDEDVGPYTVVWTYEIDGEEFQNLQGVIVIEDSDNPRAAGPYSERIAGIRTALEVHLRCAQNIPVYDEQGRICEDNRTVRFTYPRWNQNHLTRIYRNQKLVTSGITINYFKGEVIFDEPLHDQYDTVNADYNFRWFDDLDLDRFLSNALHIVNLYPPAGNRSLVNLEDRYIPLVLYGATVDALRQMILCLQFQQPREVFGGPDAAKDAANMMETLKQNYENQNEKLLEQKKYGPYRGLTQVVSVPEFTLPGGRSRWFRYMMGGFNLT